MILAYCRAFTCCMLAATILIPVEGIETKASKFPVSNRDLDSLAIIAQSVPDGGGTTATQEESAPPFEIDSDTAKFLVANQCTDEETSVKSCLKKTENINRKFGKTKDRDIRLATLVILASNYDLLTKRTKQAMDLYQKGQLENCPFSYDIKGEVIEYNAKDQIAIVRGLVTSDSPDAPAVISDPNLYLAVVAKVKNLRAGQPYRFSGACFGQDIAISFNQRGRIFIVSPISADIIKARRQIRSYQKELQQYDKFTNEILEEYNRLTANP